MGPFMLGHLDLSMRRHFRSQGNGFFKINRLMEGFNHNTIQTAVAEADLATPGVAAKFEHLSSLEAIIHGGTAEAPAKNDDGTPAAALTGAIGDGSLLQNLIAAFKSFISSDIGKALIAALEKLLIGFLIP